MKLMIVESPAKAKTIEKYLGKDFKVLASYGHVRDLVSKDGSVEPDNDFEMKWEINLNQSKLKDIEKGILVSDEVLLATDPDREGEAISWHLKEIFKDQLKNMPVQRVVFHEITKLSVKKAIAAPRDINMSLVNAYLARRALDYLVGFKLSPILWRKLPKSKSAGRVQSVALRLIYERECEIDDFKTEEYWDIDGCFSSQNGSLTAKLFCYDNEPLKKFDIKNEKEANTIKENLSVADYYVSSVEKKITYRKPFAPFITSTLQQEASRKLGFSARTTMSLAQKLYEGILINGEQTGLITYMRTDSVNLSDDAMSSIRGVIKKTYSEEYLPKAPLKYTNKVKNAQEAHEAIRPSRFDISPAQIKNELDGQLFALYDLIWKRAIASQMSNAKFNQLKLEISNVENSNKFRATGSTLLFDGFLKVYDESDDLATKDDEDLEKKELLPNIKKGDSVRLDDVIPLQHFTKPPFRYTEASLVKKLEELGIGRPSTYATILYVLQQRGYVKLSQKKFFIEDLGRFVTSFLKNFFSKYLEFDFTAILEQKLDDVSNGKVTWKGILNEFWYEFYENIKEAEQLRITDVINYLESDLNNFLFKNQDGEIDKKCLKCDGILSLKLGRYGAFISCSNYPDCSYTKPIKMPTDKTNDDETLSENSDGENKFEEKILGNLDGEDIIIKKGPYGFYLSHKEGKKTKRTSIPKSINLENVDYDLAVKLLSLPKKLGNYEEHDVSISIGPFGPYIKWNSKYFSVKDFDVFINLDFDSAIQIIKNPPKKKVKKNTDESKSKKKVVKRVSKKIEDKN